MLIDEGTDNLMMQLYTITIDTHSTTFFWVSTFCLFWLAFFLLAIAGSALESGRIVLFVLSLSAFLVVLSGVFIHWWLDWLT